VEVVFFFKKKKERMSGSRDLFAMTKNQHNNPIWESTSDALLGLHKNPLGTQFRTNSISNLNKRSSGMDHENQLPSQLNSPPEQRLRLSKPSETASPFSSIVERRITNPTRSPIVKRAVQQQPSSPAVTAVPISDQVNVAVPSTTSAMLEVTVPLPAQMKADMPAAETQTAKATPPARRSMFSSMKKSRAKGSGSPKGAGLKDSPAKQRLKWAMARNDNLGGLRDRGSSDQIIQEQGDNRSKACTELCETEKRYLLRLQSLRAVAIGLKDESIISEEEARALFSNLDSVEQLTRGFVEELDGAMQGFSSANTEISPVLIKWQPPMKIYGVYLKSYGASQTLFSNIKKREKDEKKGRKSLETVLERLDANVQLVQNWLAEPFQRVTRYPVLVAEIVKHTMPSHPDFHGLEKALEGFRQLVHLINEEVRFAEQSALYVQFKSALHSVDAEQLQNEGNEKTRVLRFDGMFRLLAEEDVALTDPSSAESSTDILIKELGKLDGYDLVQQQQQRLLLAPDTFMPVQLDLSQVPHRLCVEELDEELKRYRAEQGGDDCSMDSLDDSMVRHVVLLSDLLVVLVQEGKELAMEHLIPLEVAWLIPTSDSSIALAWPAGLLHLAPDRDGVRLVSSLPPRSCSTALDWRAQIGAALEARMKDVGAAARRRGCSVYLEEGKLQIEEKPRQVAKQHGDSGLTREMIVELSQKKPKKKVTLKPSFKTRLGF
jgi:hypothetical protein